MMNLGGDVVLPRRSDLLVGELGLFEGRPSWRAQRVLGRRRGRVRWDHKSLPHDDVERFGPNEDWLLAVGSGGQPGRKGASG
jgi:hypothetical protein